LKSFETRNEAEEQTNSTSYKALSGHYLQKSLYTYKKLKIKWFHKYGIIFALGCWAYLAQRKKKNK
jgi:hypothetical protein